MDVFLVPLPVAVSLGGLILLYRRGGGSVKRVFERTPRSTVADAASSGACRLSGRAVPVGAVSASEASGRSYLARAGDRSEFGRLRRDAPVRAGGRLPAGRRHRYRADQRGRGRVAVERDFEAPDAEARRLGER